MTISWGVVRSITTRAVAIFVRLATGRRRSASFSYRTWPESSSARTAEAAEICGGRREGSGVRRMVGNGERVVRPPGSRTGVGGGVEVASWAPTPATGRSVAAAGARNPRTAATARRIAGRIVT
ncbi:MAG: hypothetical protein KatS3mg014_1351 [Actinomycetota bacterium]|nr:MAG: hypothetical protein KatS3mg014_1351 [Actinomycetota bacterium]